ncbi:AIPR family protein [uncultured Cyclobacterium sp.]|uniref:AIPR family protein n=1 Tax=uncultured Cyclobacterium sp. TaxID=453820 RepID=UPI0030EC3484|tara:strand:- start:2437 stop:4437 length:2001 start_codon:yes stop_codon:yes gene_type:complete
MQVEPIINARFKQFRQRNELENIQDGEAFERFVNYTIFSLHQPDAFSADSELLDFVCVGGSADMGIDGIAIKVNGILIKTKSDIKDIIKRFKRIDVEFIFIQSKYKPNFNKGELNNFVDGVRDFLSEEHNFPMNDAVKQQLELKEYILSDDVIIMWETNPQVSLYYVAMGRWRQAPDLMGIQTQFQRDLNRLNVYEKINFHFVDSEALKDIYDSIQNTFTATIDTRHIMPLTDVDDVSNSCLSIVFGSEFMKLISTEDGVIRKSLFNDNVRDFQGINPVNSEIYDTIEKNPEQFIILNNGITIVCDEFKQNNTKLSISNPQIVNGCQTSHVLHEAFKRNINIENVPISIKFISTTKEDIVNDIVRGTNRQNIVLEEAFETTKKFHKDLEEFFGAFSPDYQVIYYERRSKQFQHNPTIKQTEKINLKVLTQYFIGMFLNNPHNAHRHESILLKDYGNDIFQDGHSKLPYFITAYTFLRLEKFIRSQKLSNHIKSYKPHILMLFRESIAGYIPSFYKEKSIDSHCQRILCILKDDEMTLVNFTRVIELFDRAMVIWERDLGKSRRGTKDVEAFTNHLLKVSREQFVHEKIEQETDNDKTYSGKVVNIIRDKFGNKCGFIQRVPEDIFFHSLSNSNIDFDYLRGRWVKYKVEKNIKTNRESAIDVEIIK